jgi:hypothetical protein
LSEEEEKKLSRLEKRLVAFDDQALNALGFSTDIYYMLGHLGWVQFSNCVGRHPQGVCLGNLDDYGAYP